MLNVAPFSLDKSQRLCKSSIDRPNSATLNVLIFVGFFLWAHLNHLVWNDDTHEHWVFSKNKKQLELDLVTSEAKNGHNLFQLLSFHRNGVPKHLGHLTHNVVVLHHDWKWLISFFVYVVVLWSHGLFTYLHNYVDLQLCRRRMTPMHS